MSWWLVSERNPNYRLGLARSNGQCVGRGCEETAEEVVDRGGGRLAAYCRACRRSEVGSTPEERPSAAERTMSLFPDLEKSR